MKSKKLLIILAVLFLISSVAFADHEIKDLKMIVDGKEVTTAYRLQSPVTLSAVVIEDTTQAPIDSVKFECGSNTIAVFSYVDTLYESSWNIANIDPGTYQFKVTAIDTLGIELTSSKYLYIREMDIVADSCFVTPVDTVNNNVVIDNANAYIEVVLTGPDWNSIEGVYVEVINRTDSAILDTIYLTKTDSIWAHNFANQIDDILDAAAPGDTVAEKVNVDFAVTLYDTTGAYWIYQPPVPNFENIWIDGEPPILPDYDGVVIKDEGENPVDLTTVPMFGAGVYSIELAAYDSFTHIVEAQILNIFPAGITVTDTTIDVENKKVIFGFTADADVYKFKFDVKVYDLFNNNWNERSYIYLNSNALAKLDVWDYDTDDYDYLERYNQYKVEATVEQLPTIDDVDFLYKNATDTADVSNPWVDIAIDPSHLGNTYTIRGECRFEDDVVPPKVVPEDGMDFVAITEVNGLWPSMDEIINAGNIYPEECWTEDWTYDQKWDYLITEGYVAYIQYQDTTPPDVFIEDIEGAIVIDSVRYVLIDSTSQASVTIKPDPTTVYGNNDVTKIDYFVKGDADAGPIPIGTVYDYDPSFPDYTWNIDYDLVYQKHYELWAIGFDDMEEFGLLPNEQTTINKVDLYIEHTSDPIPPTGSIEIVDSYFEYADTVRFHIQSSDDVIVSGLKIEYMDMGRRKNEDWNLLGTIMNPDPDITVEYLVPDSFPFPDSLYVDHVYDFRLSVMDYLGLIDSSAVITDTLINETVEEVKITAIAGYDTLALLNNNHLHGDSLWIVAEAAESVGGFKFYSSTDTTNWILIGEIETELSTTIDTLFGWNVNVLPEGTLYIGAVSLDATTYPSSWIEVYIDNSVGMIDTTVTHNIEAIIDDTVNILLETRISDIDPVAVFGCYFEPDSHFVNPDSHFVNFEWNTDFNYDTYAIPDGTYDFHIKGSDLSIPIANEQDFVVAQGIMVDNYAPDITGFTINDEEMTSYLAPPSPEYGPEVPAGNNTLKFDAEDLGTGIYTAKVTITFDGAGGEVLPDNIVWDEEYASGVMNTLSLERTINMSEFPLGQYYLDVTLTDYNGHTTTAFNYGFQLKSVNITPTPFISAIDETDMEECQIQIYAITKICNPNIYQILPDFVRFERWDGAEWIDLGNAMEVEATPTAKLWRLGFNYDTYYDKIGMDDIRAVSYGVSNSGTTYEVIGPTIVPHDVYVNSRFDMTGETDAKIYADVVAQSNKSIIVSLAENNEDESDDSEIVETSSGSNGYTGILDATDPRISIGNANGTVTLWTFDPDDYELKGYVLNIQKVTAEFGSNGIIEGYYGTLTADIPANAVDNIGIVYIAPVLNEYPINERQSKYLELASSQIKVITNANVGPDAEKVDYTMIIDHYDADAVYEVRYYDNGEWKYDGIDKGEVIDGVISFCAELSNDVYAVFKNSMELVISDIEVTNGFYNNYTTIMPEFRAYINYYGEQDELDVDVIFDSVLIVDNCLPIVDGFNFVPPTRVPAEDYWKVELITTEELEVEEHTVKFIVEDRYENVVETALLTFNIDDTSPVVQSEGGYINHIATFGVHITDTGTGIDVSETELCLYNPSGLGLALDYPAETLIWSEEDSVYITLTTDDLSQLMVLNSQDVNEIVAKWTLKDNIGNETVAEWIYVVDIAPPIISDYRPIGDPIDNDNDGLFNEDPPNGFNDDGDWDDINGNGIRDMYCVGDTHWVWEPWKIDEDPIDFYAASVIYGNNIVISAEFEDIQRETTFLSTGPLLSGASGIDVNDVKLYINGIEIDTISINNGLLTYVPSEDELSFGSNIVNVTVPDIAGNVTVKTFEFELIASAPTVEFLPLEYDGQETWYFNPGENTDNVFKFAVNWIGSPEVVQYEVKVSFYEQPDTTLIQGPSTIQAESIDGTTANYSIALGSNVMDESASGIIIEVMAENIWSASSTNRQTYKILQSRELAFMPVDGSRKIHFSDNPMKNEAFVYFKLTKNAVVYATIYDFAGRKVRELRANNGSKCISGNEYYVKWNGINDDGEEVARGGYIAHFEAIGTESKVKASEWIKIAVMK